jgi:hypothetical protein
MNFKTTILLTFSLAFNLSALDDKTKASSPIAPPISAIEAAKEHILAVLTGDLEGMGKSFAKSVILMPHHELLGKRHGFAGKDGRKVPTRVEGAKVAAAYKKHVGDPKPVEQARAMLNQVKFTAIKAKVGDFAIAPPDAEPLKSPDGKLHFQMKEGDALIKFQPPRGDFILFQLRAIGGTWRVVAEYWD